MNSNDTSMLEADEDPEIRIVESAKALDGTVWSAWYDEYYSLLFRYAFARLGSREDAEDVVSQVFVNALQGISSYRYRGRPMLAWFYRIAHNLVTDRLRSQRQRNLDAMQPEVSPARLWPDASLDALVLKDALASLKTSQREVIVLRYYAQLSIREVSEVLRKSESAVQSLQIRGIESLRRFIKPEEQSERRTGRARSR